MAISDEAKAPSDHGNVRVTARFLNEATEPFALQMDRDSTLVNLVNTALERGERQLPEPRPERPLDTLHNLRHDEPGEPIGDLDQALWVYVREPHTTHDFGITLVRAFRVNTRWDVAPKTEMTPREILEVVNLDYTQFTLYPVGSSELYPLDQPITVERGSVFEAQRDGKYGE